MLKRFISGGENRFFRLDFFSVCEYTIPCDLAMECQFKPRGTKKMKKNPPQKKPEGQKKRVSSKKTVTVRTMPPRIQIFRLARIAALLKKNSCPTAERLLKEYESLEFEEGKTVRAKYSPQY